MAEPTQEEGKKLIALMHELDMKVSAINIVYLRDCDPDRWVSRNPKPNAWNCAAVIVKNDGTVLLNNTATSVPGKYYTYNPLNDGGCARIGADNQNLKSHTFGLHRGYPALIQCGDVLGYRDLNQDFQNEGKEETTLTPYVQVNLHGCNGGDGGDEIDRWSAGCCVHKYWQSHLKRLQICRDSGNQYFDLVIIKGTTYNTFKGS